MKLIDKDALVAEIEKLKEENKPNSKSISEYIKGGIYGFDLAIEKTLSILNTLEVKESLTWEDIRELYIIFAEVDVEIEFCKTTNIQAETIGYYQEVLKRFKLQKGE